MEACRQTIKKDINYLAFWRKLESSQDSFDTSFVNRNLSFSDLERNTIGSSSNHEEVELAPLFLFLASSFNVELVYVILKGITQFSYVA